MTPISRARSVLDQRGLATDGRTLWLQSDDKQWYGASVVKDGSDYVLQVAQAATLVPRVKGSKTAVLIGSDAQSYELSLVTDAGSVVPRVSQSPVIPVSRFRQVMLTAADGAVKALQIVLDAGSVVYQIA